MLISRGEVEGNIRTQGKTKLIDFPRDLTLSVLLYFNVLQQQKKKRIRLSGATSNPEKAGLLSKKAWSQSQL